MVVIERTNRGEFGFFGSKVNGMVCAGRLSENEPIQEPHMNKWPAQFSLRTAFFVAFVAAMVIADNVAASSQTTDKHIIRIVNCEQHVQSRKRGVGANHLNAADFRALAPGVSWYYNWHFEPGEAGNPPDGVPMEFLPMGWGDRPESLSGLEHYLAS